MDIKFAGFCDYQASSGLASNEQNIQHNDAIPKIVTTPRLVFGKNLESQNYCWKGPMGTTGQLPQLTEECLHHPQENQPLLRYDFVTRLFYF